MESYLIACHKCTKHAIETVVVKLIRGELKDMPKAWAPSPAELSSAIRDEMTFVARQVELAAERQMIEDNRRVAVPVKLIDQRVAEAKERMLRERRKLLFTVASHDQFLSRRRDIPSDGVYLSILAAAYGGPGSLDAVAAAPAAVDPSDLVSASEDEMQAILRADMFEPEPLPEPEPEEPPAPAPEPEFQDVEF